VTAVGGELLPGGVTLEEALAGHRLPEREPQERVGGQPAEAGEDPAVAEEEVGNAK
jgi:hypothetical protein